MNTYSKTLANNWQLPVTSFICGHQVVTDSSVLVLCRLMDNQTDNNVPTAQTAINACYYVTKPNCFLFFFKNTVIITVVQLTQALLFNPRRDS